MTADSVFDRLARRPANRVTTRISERFTNRSPNGRCCRVATRLRERFTMGFRRRNDDNNEKRAKKQRHWLDVFAATNRFWQCIAALILYGIYTYFLMSENSGSLPDQTLSSAIESLATGNIIYHPNVLLIVFLLRRSKETKGWRFFAVSSIIGDFFMMFLALTKLTILSSAGVMAECHGQEKTGFFKSMLSNGAAFARTRFGWGSHHDHQEPDLICCLPKLVYLLCAISIFSYTFSILFTGLQLQRSRLSKSQPPHLEDTLPTFLPPRTSLDQDTQPVDMTQRQSYSSTRPSSPILPHYTRRVEIPDFDPIPRGRSSQETTSSFNPDLYLVSDGFRPVPDPPTYFSRPPSYRSGPPSYRSRPSSMHTVEIS